MDTKNMTLESRLLDSQDDIPSTESNGGFATSFAEVKPKISKSPDFKMKIKLFLSRSWKKINTAVHEKSKQSAEHTVIYGCRPVHGVVQMCAVNYAFSYDFV